MKKAISLFKLILRTTLIVFIALTLFLITGYFYARSNYYNIPVLMYHHISPAEEGNIVNVTPDRFKKQMEFINNHNYNVITPDEYVRCAREEKEIKSKNLVLITFDDGYEDNFTYAYPVLKENNFPAVVFVVVNKLGKEDYLTIDQIKKMQQSGIIFGSHTLNEVYLPSLDEAAVKGEVRGSKIKLEKITAKPVNFFAYCTGGYTKEAQNILRLSGYLMAFTTNRGFNKDRRNNDDIFAIRRIKITDRDNWFSLWAKSTGIYHLFHRVRNPY